jgi:L-fuculose-phosphate aldolase
MITAIGNVMRTAHERGWITTRDGNCSVRRRNSKMMYITPSGWRKTIIHPEHMIKCRFTATSVSIPPNTTPSGELEMHRQLLQNCERTRSVVHLHPTNIIAAMYAGWDLQVLASEFPEVSRYTKVGPSTPVLPVTSDVLASATSEALGLNYYNGEVAYDIVGQAAHGVCSVGSNPWEAFEHIERLEHICEIALKSGVTPKGVMNES